MNFKKPIASNQETKNWVTKDTQIKPSNPEFKASNQETKNWVTKETQFKARNQEFSQLGKQKKNQETKMKIKKIETW